MSAVERVAARYTDGSTVREGDRIRYVQKPGGLLPPSREWRYGVAAWGEPLMGEQSMVLQADNGRRYYLIGHIIERVEA